MQEAPHLNLSEDDNLVRIKKVAWDSYGPCARARPAKDVRRAFAPALSPPWFSRIGTASRPQARAGVAINFPAPSPRIGVRLVNDDMVSRGITQQLCVTAPASKTGHYVVQVRAATDVIRPLDDGCWDGVGFWLVRLTQDHLVSSKAATANAGQTHIVVVVRRRLSVRLMTTG
jgi:hypothetical protein